MAEVLKYEKYANKFNKTIPRARNKNNRSTSDSGGGNMNDKYITKDVFEEYQKRIDDKLDTMPNLIGANFKAEINSLEARQTKWFIGITISLVFGVIGIIINIFI